MSLHPSCNKMDKFYAIGRVGHYPQRLDIAEHVRKTDGGEWPIDSRIRIPM